MPFIYIHISLSEAEYIFTMAVEFENNEERYSASLNENDILMADLSPPAHLNYAHILLYDDSHICGPSPPTHGVNLNVYTPQLSLFGGGYGREGGRVNNEA